MSRIEARPQFQACWALGIPVEVRDPADATPLAKGVISEFGTDGAPVIAGRSWPLDKFHFYAPLD